jgi:transcriptional regulator with XRE-family HTH domain
VLEMFMVHQHPRKVRAARIHVETIDNRRRRLVVDHLHHIGGVIQMVALGFDLAPAIGGMLEITIKNARVAHLPAFPLARWTALYRRKSVRLVRSPRMTRPKCSRVTPRSSAAAPMPLIRFPRGRLRQSFGFVTCIYRRASPIYLGLSTIIYADCFCSYYPVVPKKSGLMNERERDICARFKLIRERINWSQAPFAERLGITLNQLASIEHGRTPLRYEIAWRARAAFDVSLRWLDEGFVAADRREHDNLPVPEMSGFGPQALLSTVAEKFSDGGGGLRAIGPLPAEANRDKTDIDHRLFLEGALKLHAELWMADVPRGHTTKLVDELIRHANKFIKSLPADPPSETDKRAEAITWARIRDANAKKLLSARSHKKESVDTFTDSRKSADMKSELKGILAKVAAFTKAKGAKGKLAKTIGVPQSRLSEWLAGKHEPSGDIALKLLRWVERQEAK